MQPEGNGDKQVSARPFAAAAPSVVHRPQRYYREPWTVTFWDQLKLFSVQLLCVGGSGAIAKTAVAPLERIKILLQVQQATSPSSQHYKGFMDALRRVPEQEGGWKALYRGNGANVLRLVPEVGFRFLVHDQLKLMFAPITGSTTPSTMDKLAAGAATGVLRSLLFYPLDLARVKITADTSSSRATRQYTSLRQCLGTTYYHEGVRGLYRGMLTSMAGIVPYLSISLTAYDTFKQQIPVDKHSRSQWWYPLLKMGAGSGAAVVAQVMVYPLDTLRRRLQATHHVHKRNQNWIVKEGRTIYKGPIHCLQQIVQKEGISALYKGLGVSCLRTVPGAAIQFVAYDFIKTTIAIIDPTTGVTSPL